jgi:carbon monoxide dehydrogenase subunit G
MRRLPFLIGNFYSTNDSKLHTPRPAPDIDILCCPTPQNLLGYSLTDSPQRPIHFEGHTMDISVNIDLAYEFEVKAKAADVFALLSDVPSSVSHFPKVEKLTDMGDGVYKWEMEKVGTAQVNIQTVYASKYVSNKTKGTVVWTPVKGVGNAQVGGNWSVTDNKKSTGITLAIKGTVDVPLPGLMKMIVSPVVEGEFEKLVDQYIANLIKKFGGEV